MSGARAPAVPPPGHHGLDPHRPRWHFTAPAGATGRPAALAWLGGRWRLYYQLNPYAAQPGRQHWGHASSADLVHWRDEPLALSPSTEPTGHDAEGCGPGCLALVDGQPTLFYTGELATAAHAPDSPAAAGRRQVQCVATSADGAVWTPQPGRSLTLPPAGVPPGEFRHPFVLQWGGWWYLLVGASREGQQGQCLLYRSADGIHWQYRHPLFEAPDAADGRLWERPVLVPLGGVPGAAPGEPGTWLLTLSVWPQQGALWFTGRFEDERFIPTRRGVLDADGGALAHLALAAGDSPDGRTLQWAWIPEQRSLRRIEPAGWAGALSVPRTLSVDSLGRLVSWPAAELHALREAEVPVQGSGERRGVLARWAGDNLDIEARFHLAGRRRAGLTLRASPDGEEATRIVWWPQARRLLIERERSSIDGRTRHQNVQGTLVLADDEPLVLRVLLDRSVLEVFANGRLTLVTRIYPLRADSLQAWAWSEGEATLQMQAWALRGIHAGRPWPAGEGQQAASGADEAGSAGASATAPAATAAAALPAALRAAAAGVVAYRDALPTSPMAPGQRARRADPASHPADLPADLPAADAGRDFDSLEDGLDTLPPLPADDDPDTLPFSDDGPDTEIDGWPLPARPRR